MRVLAATIVAALAATTGGAVAHSASATPPFAIAPASVALDWNTAAVTAVRAAQVPNETATGMRGLYQTEGMLYMGYVQAAVYDAATKIGHRYEPYHHFNAPAGNASLAAAVIAAAYNTLVYYLGDPSGESRRRTVSERRSSTGEAEADSTTSRSNQGCSMNSISPSP